MTRHLLREVLCFVVGGWALATAADAAVFRSAAAKDQSCASGPDTCANGYVWRGATPEDHACVRPAARDVTARENQTPNAHRRKGGGDFGAETCREGFVWRNATAADHICVPSSRRDLVQRETELSQSHTACHLVTRRFVNP